MKKAFTLIELMAVVAIIGILMAIVVTAAANSIRVARKHKAKTIVKCVQAGLDTYRAQKDDWPEPFDASPYAENYRKEIPAETARQMIKTLIKESVQNNNPMMDISGLYVSRRQGSTNKGDASHYYNYGFDFWEAVRGSERTGKKMAVSEMWFGYPESSHGYFRNLRIYYRPPTDSMEVTL